MNQPARSSSSNLAHWGKIYAVVLVILTVTGGYHIRSYLATWDIPFPIESGALGTTLIAFGIVSSLFIFALSTILLITSYVQLNVYGIDFLKLIKLNKRGLVSNSPWQILWNIACFSTAPVFIGILGFFFLKPLHPLDSELANASIYTCAIFFSYTLVLAANRCSHRKRFPSIFFTILTIEFFSIAAWVLVTSILIESGSVRSNLGVAIATTFICFVNAIGLIPTPVSRKSSKFPQRFSIVAVAGAVLFVVSLHPVLSHQIGKATLRFFSIGGELEQIIYYPESEIEKAPKNLANEIGEFSLESTNSESDQHRSKDIQYAIAKNALLIFKTGDVSYYASENYAFKINTQNLIIVTTKKELSTFNIR
jgi:hypothetical protein